MSVSLIFFPGFGENTKIAHFCWFEPSNTVRAVLILCTVWCVHAARRTAVLRPHALLEEGAGCRLQNEFGALNALVLVTLGQEGLGVVRAV